MIPKKLFKIVLCAFLAHAFTAYSYDDQLKRKCLSPERAEKLKQKTQSAEYQEKIKKHKEHYKSSRDLEDFQGWWQITARETLFGFGLGGPYFGNGTSDVDCYIFIDTTTDPVTITTLAGTPYLPRELTNLDAPGGIFLNTYYLASPTELVNTLDLDGPDFDPTNGQSWWSLKLQPDGTIAASFDSRPEFVAFTASIVTTFHKVDAPQQPVRPFDATDSAFPDVTNPVNIAQYIYNALTLNYNNPQNINYHDTDYRSFYEREAIFAQLIDEGFTFTTPIRRLRVSQPGAHYLTGLNRAGSPPFITTDLVTDIFTDGYSYVTAGSTVEIGGFVGPWARLNGTYVNGVAFLEEGALPNPHPTHIDVNEDQTRGTFRNVFNHFLLDFDSSAMPHDEQGWGLGVCGNPYVRVTHRFTPDMEYPAFRAAVEAMFYLMYRTSFHHGFNAYFPPGSLFMFDTWDELKAAAATNNYWSSPSFPGDNLVRTRINQPVPSGFYNNAVLAERPVTAYNDPFGLTQAPGNTYDYNIVLANYIVQPKNLYYAIAGTPDLTPVAPNGAPLQFDPVDIGYKPAIPGPQRAEFVGALGDIIVVDGIPQPQNPDPTYYTLMGAGASDDDTRNSNGYYLGLIDPALTGGKKIGYLRWVDHVSVDTDLFLLNSTFPPVAAGLPPSQGGTNLKYSREALSQVFSNYTRFFNQQNCEAIIFDIRTNNGGYIETSYAFAEFLGADRVSLGVTWSANDNGNSALLDLDDPLQYSFFQDVTHENCKLSYGYFYVSQNETTYGADTIFRGSPGNPKKVIVLTDNTAVSAADFTPHIFLGENLDGNLGSNTTGMIIGDIDGRLKGAASNRSPVPVSLDSNRLYNPNGTPFTPIRYRADLPSGNVSDGITDIYYNQQTEGTAPSPAPSLKGTAGGTPLPNDWSTNVWPALGFIPPYPGLFDPRIPKGLPVANVPETARDPWLEQCILLAVYGNN